jgi:hypothetical protein
MIHRVGMVLPACVILECVFVMIGATLLRVAILVGIVLPALATAPDVVRSMKIRSMWRPGLKMLNIDIVTGMNRDSAFQIGAHCQQA